MAEHHGQIGLALFNEVPNEGSSGPLAPRLPLSILTPQQMVFNQRVINEGIQQSAVSAVPIIWTKLTVISPSYMMNTLLLFQQEESQVEEMKQEEHFSK